MFSLTQLGLFQQVFVVGNSGTSVLDLNPENC